MLCCIINYFLYEIRFLIQSSLTGLQMVPMLNNFNFNKIILDWVSKYEYQDIVE